MKTIRMWAVDEGEDGQRSVRPVESVENAETEELLEELLVRLPELLMEDLVLVGRQVPSGGGALDLLGLDEDGRLVDSPVLLSPQDWGTVSLRDARIAPQATYEIRMITDGLESSPASVTTARWGDVIGPFTDGAWTPPDGSVDIIDVVAILERFMGLATAPPVAWADLRPATPDGVIDILDATMALDAFKGYPYPFEPPCP